jgi:hypothetical protein
MKLATMMRNWSEIAVAFQAGDEAWSPSGVRNQNNTNILPTQMIELRA